MDSNYSLDLQLFLAQLKVPSFPDWLPDNEPSIVPRLSLLLRSSKKKTRVNNLHSRFPRNRHAKNSMDSLQLYFDQRGISPSRDPLRAERVLHHFSSSGSFVRKTWSDPHLCGAQGIGRGQFRCIIWSNYCHNWKNIPLLSAELLKCSQNKLYFWHTSCFIVRIKNKSTLRVII